MALYEFICVCGHKFERIVNGYNEEAVAVCPKCDKVCKRELFSRNSFILAGSGWTPKGR